MSGACERCEKCEEGFKKSKFFIYEHSSDLQELKAKIAKHVKLHRTVVNGCIQMCEKCYEETEDLDYLQTGFNFRNNFKQKTEAMYKNRLEFP